MPSTLQISPAGQTTVLNVANVATSATITSLVPVNSYYITNTGNNAVQVRLDPTTQTTPVFPTATTSSLGVVLGSQDDIVLNIPAALAIGTNQFVTTIYLSAISTTTTVNTIFVTPVQVN